MICDFDCFNCKFSDCILDFESGSFVELEEISSREIDDILFKKDSDSIVVPDWRQYPFIPSDEIPYNPKWKSQAKWREYYRSRARGNRKEKVSAKKKEYYQKHLEEFRERHRKYYEKHREECLARSREYYNNKNKDRHEKRMRKHEEYVQWCLSYQKEHPKKERKNTVDSRREYYYRKKMEK